MNAPAGVVALTGMMGSGKSTAARELARLLGLPVRSTDAEVVAMARMPVARIFTERGEHTFRALERRAVAALCHPCVADLGGGAFCDPESATRLLALGRVFFLDVSAAEAARRIGGAGPGAPARPLAESWRPLLARRRPLYARAHHRIGVDALSPEAVARRVYDRLRGTGGGSCPSSRS